MDSQPRLFTPSQASVMEREYRIIRRSVDARQRDIKVLLTFLLDSAGNPIPRNSPIPLYEAPCFAPLSSSAPCVHIIGAGPAGLFAALSLIEQGVRPIVYERGKDVSSRKRDIALLNRNQGINQESNYCFGEGGAGTFSDGKLFSRSKKRGNMQRVMEWFHYFGAPDTVLYETHAHIGSDLLPSIIRRMRECIIGAGGEIHFESCMDEVFFAGLVSKARPTIIAIGHSAHDTYRLLARHGVSLQAKGWAMGVRVEHPQGLINGLLYHLNDSRSGSSSSLVDLLGNASYSLVTQVRGRGVYSFCMCPGGHIVPASSRGDECIVNGMSASHRNSPYANSGIVVELHPESLPVPVLNEPYYASLRGMYYQEWLEHLAKQNGGPQAQAPAQRLRDFVEGKVSSSLCPTSYLPGVVSSPLHQWMPEDIGPYLQQGFRDFDRKYRGFLTNEAMVLGVESRSSSPVRILRDNETMQSLSHPWIYPCGEGAGYAGGITSSALDGIRAAEQIVKRLDLMKG